MRSQRDERAPVSGFERHVAALIWDMDGTLIDSATVVPDAFIATTAALGGTSCTRDEVVALYSLGEPATMLGHLLDRPASRSDVDAYHRELASRADGVRPSSSTPQTCWPCSRSATIASRATPRARFARRGSALGPRVCR
jgi:hypothetical protein